MPQQPYQPNTVDLPKKWPLIILPENRQEDTSKDARLVNAYMEKSLRGEFSLYKRPGLATSTQPSGGAGTGRGTFNWKGNIYAIVGTTLYKDGVSKGTVDGTNGVYRFSSCLGSTPKLQLGNGVKAYNYDDTNGLVQIISTGTTITAGSFIVGYQYTILTVGTTNFVAIGAASDTVGVIFTATGVGSGTGTATVTNFPSTFVKGWAYLDGTTYVMRSDAGIQGSALNDPTTWPVLNLIIAQIDPDAGIALAKQLVYVVAIKEGSTEIFYNANTSPAPLGRVQGAKINHGCISADSVRELDGALFWLSTNKNGAVQVIKVDNLKAEIVSSQAIERLMGEADFSAVYSWTLKYEGHRWYAFTLKNNNLTLAFDVTTGLWSQWTDVNGNYFPIVDSTYITASARTILQHESDGYLYTVDSANVTDNGAVITVDIFTPGFDNDTDRNKVLHRMFFDADQHVGSVLQARCNDHDYAADKWTNFRLVDLGQKRPSLSNCGTFRKRAYNFRHQSLTRFRIRSVGLQIDNCTV